MFSLELIHSLNADREREIREHVRVRKLLREARENEEHADCHAASGPATAWLPADRTHPVKGGTR